MISIKNELEKRKIDIDSYYSLLNLIEQSDIHKGVNISIDSDKNRQVMVDDVMHKCLKANSIILLYNSVESTISNCIISICDAINDSNIKYNDLSSAFQKIFRNKFFNKDISHTTARKKAEELVVHVVNDKKINMPDIDFSISGNIDLRKIIEICKVIDIKLGKIPNKDKVSNTLVNIKNTRNDLAHGNKSFGDIGALVVLSDLNDYKETIYGFLEYLIENFISFIQEKKFMAINKQ